VGLTYVSGAAIGSADEEVDVDFLVDSDAQYTVLPEHAWQSLGLAARRQQRFRLADGSLTYRDLATCAVRLANLGETPTRVVLGQPGDFALLGAPTLEELGLVLNPFTRTLHPADLLLV